MTVATMDVTEVTEVTEVTDARRARLHEEHADVALFLATYWPAVESDDAAALHTILRAGRRDDVARWRRGLVLFLRAPADDADDADKVAFVRAATRRRFPTERSAAVVAWLGTIAQALREIEDYLAP